MAELKAFLFDLDGTLIDSEVIYVEAVRNALRAKGYNLTKKESEALVYGISAQDIFLETVRRFPGSYTSTDDMGIHIREHFYALKAERDIRIHGSIALLRDLSREFPVAIVSGSPREDIAAGIEMMEISDDVSFYLGTEDYSPGKPDPTCYLLAAEKCEVSPQNCLVFEDSSAGVVAAKRAGAWCIALKRNGAAPQDLSSADAIYADLSEFDLSRFERDFKDSTSAE
ncbi:MAG: HAD family phosphatase [Acidobacteriota bacterium]|nr:MAG: HAD family phosphatase [Acidobacteriota bacterium]